MIFLPLVGAGGRREEKETHFLKQSSEKRDLLVPIKLVLEEGREREKELCTVNLLRFSLWTG